MDVTTALQQQLVVESLTIAACGRWIIDTTRRLIMRLAMRLSTAHIRLRAIYWSNYYCLMRNLCKSISDILMWMLDSL